jgi:MarC family integral membrane protein
MTADLRQIVEGALLVVAALFPIVNPLGGAPIFLAMTSNYTREERASLAWRVSVNAFVLLVASRPLRRASTVTPRCAPDIARRSTSCTCLCQGTALSCGSRMS